MLNWIKSLFAKAPTVASITADLKTIVTNLESHAAAKAQEVDAHARAEIAAAEARFAASKEVDEAKAVAAKIGSLITA